MVSNVSSFSLFYFRTPGFSFLIPFFSFSVSHSNSFLLFKPTNEFRSLLSLQMALYQQPDNLQIVPLCAGVCVCVCCSPAEAFEGQFSDGFSSSKLLSGPIRGTICSLVFHPSLSSSCSHRSTLNCYLRVWRCSCASEQGINPPLTQQLYLAVMLQIVCRENLKL